VPALIDLTLDTTVTPVLHPARIHGAACTLLRTHEGGRLFSAAPPRPEGRRARWRLGWLAAQPPTLAPGHVTFGDTEHAVLDRRVVPISHLELSNTPPRRHAAVQVISPMYFSRNGRDHPLPDPVLAMQSLIRRWDGTAPRGLSVPADAARSLIDVVWLAGMDGRTVAGQVGARTFQIGFVGDVEFALTRRATNADATLFAALLAFAELAGLGAQTGHGFGSVALRP